MDKFTINGDNQSQSNLGEEDNTPCTYLNYLISSRSYKRSEAKKERGQSSD